MVTITLTHYQEDVVTAFAKLNNITPTEYATAYWTNAFDGLAQQYTAALQAQMPTALQDDVKRPQLVALLLPQ